MDFKCYYKVMYQACDGSYIGGTVRANDDRDAYDAAEIQIQKSPSARKLSRVVSVSFYRYP